MKQTIAAQISCSLTSPNDPCFIYYKEKWGKTPGFFIASDHWMEIPPWIAILSGHIPELTYRTIDRNWYKFPDHATVYGSVLDVNRRVWQDLTLDNPKTNFVLGGYSEAIQGKNVVWKDGLTGQANYRLFKGLKCVPRLQLSSGCLYNCAFCTIPRTLAIRKLKDILADAWALAPLYFELIYIDDKTFGQANNIKVLKEVIDLVRSYNPAFKGFIVQSTAVDALKGLPDWQSNLGVCYVEIGVETINDPQLVAWRKPHREKHIRTCFELARKLRMPIIPNIIFGVASQNGLYDYKPTIDFLKEYADIIPFINPYMLCSYIEQKGATYSRQTAADSNENTLSKSWLSIAEQENASCALREALAL